MGDAELVPGRGAHLFKSFLYADCVQNSINCGAITVSVLLALISTGSVYDRRDYFGESSGAPHHPKGPDVAFWI